MIYVDTSVVLADILAEDRVPPASFWREELVSSRLLEYELWTRAHGRGLASRIGRDIRTALRAIAMAAMSPEVLARALDPFPVSLRTSMRCTSRPRIISTLAAAPSASPATTGA